MTHAVHATATTDTSARTELLARAADTLVRDAAERCLGLLGTPTIITSPETGIVMMQVREPVVRERFHLGEVVVTRAEVELAGHRGWAMRQGADRMAALAAAICDAAAHAGGEAADCVEQLCADTSEHLARTERQLCERLAPTVVEFEELD